MPEHDRDHDFEPIAEELRRANRAVQLPPGLLEAIDGRIRAAARRRRLAIAAPCATAAVIALLAAGWWLSAGDGPAPGEAHLAIEEQPGPAPTPAPAPVTRVRFADDSGHFARPVPTRNPNVSIVLIYRDEAARDSRSGTTRGNQS